MAAPRPTILDVVAIPEVFVSILEYEVGEPWEEKAWPDNELDLRGFQEVFLQRGVSRAWKAAFEAVPQIQ